MKGNHALITAAKAAVMYRVANRLNGGRTIYQFDDGSYDFFLVGEPVSSYNGRDYKVYQRHEYRLVATWLGAWVESEGVS